MHEPEFLQASLELFENDCVDCVEWSFDSLWNNFSSCPWLDELLIEYSSQGRLFGHGVHFSFLSAELSTEQMDYLDKLNNEFDSRNYVHSSEHFGFMARTALGKGAPLPVPLIPDVFQLAEQRLELLGKHTGTAVGLENLALAFNKEDALKHYSFINDLAANGFILLDLHNIYCQIENFGISLADVLERIDSSRVHEIHISGGSWEEAMGKRIRRDTHDDAVPDAVFDLLQAALPQLPNVKCVIFERLGNSFKNENDAIEFRSDFMKIRASVT
ncbi:MAG: DUF692 family protein [Lentisphaeria bacterium]|nr:DUF692 family protein [Lentisphaeria bacterium]